MNILARNVRPGALAAMGRAGGTDAPPRTSGDTYALESAAVSFRLPTGRSKGLAAHTAEAELLRADYVRESRGTYAEESAGALSVSGRLTHEPVTLGV